MVRPPDDLHKTGDSVRKSIILGEGTILESGAQAPLMSDATRFGDLLFLSGRAAVDPATGNLRAEGFAEQADIVLADALNVLEAGGTGPEHVLRVECWLADRADFAEWNARYAEAFPPPRPARTTLISGFAIPGMLIEVQLTAAVPS